MKIPEHPARRRLRNRLKFSIGLFGVICVALLVAIIAVLLQGGLFMVIVPVLTNLLLVSFGLLLFSSLVLFLMQRFGGHIGNPRSGHYYIDF